MVTLSSAAGSVTAAARPDAGVPRGGAAIAANLAGAEANRLMRCGDAVTNVRLEKI